MKQEDPPLQVSPGMAGQVLVFLKNDSLKTPRGAHHHNKK